MSLVSLFLFYIFHPSPPLSFYNATSIPLAVPNIPSDLRTLANEFIFHKTDMKDQPNIVWWYKARAALCIHQYITAGAVCTAEIRRSSSSSQGCRHHNRWMLGYNSRRNHRNCFLLKCWGIIIIIVVEGVWNVRRLFGVDAHPPSTCQRNMQNTFSLSLFDFIGATLINKWDDAKDTRPNI